MSELTGLDPTRACTRKKGYPTEDIAKRVARKVNFEHNDANVRAYGCTFCGLWHIGGAPNR